MMKRKKTTKRKLARVTSKRLTKAAQRKGDDSAVWAANPKRKHFAKAGPPTPPPFAKTGSLAPPKTPPDFVRTETGSLAPPKTPPDFVRTGPTTPETADDAVFYLGRRPPWPEAPYSLAAKQDEIALEHQLRAVIPEVNRLMRDAQTREQLDEGVDYLAASVTRYIKRFASHARVNKLSFVMSGRSLFDKRKIKP